MASLLNLLAPALTTLTRAKTASLEGEQLGEDRKRKTLMDELAQGRLAAQDKRQSLLDELNRKNIESQIADRERGPDETFGTPFEAMQGGKPVFVERGNRGTMRTLEGYTPPPPKATTAPGDRTTAATRVKLAEGAGQLDTIQRARAGVEAYPDAFGIKRGASLLPGMGKIGGVVNQYLDPKGITARQDVANIASLRIHDRSGAAVSVSEFPRLAAFIPQEYDKPEKIKANLDAMERELKVILAALQNGTLLKDLLAGGDGAAATPVAPAQAAPAGPANLTPFLPPRKP